MALAAYGFARFRFPFRNLLFILALSALTLPSVLIFILLQRYYIQGVVFSSGSK